MMTEKQPNTPAPKKPFQETVREQARRMQLSISKVRKLRQGAHIAKGDSK